MSEPNSWDDAKHRAETATSMFELADAIYDLAAGDQRGSSPGYDFTIDAIKAAITAWTERGK